MFETNIYWEKSRNVPQVKLELTDKCTWAV